MLFHIRGNVAQEQMSMNWAWRTEIVLEIQRKSFVTSHCSEILGSPNIKLLLMWSLVNWLMALRDAIPCNIKKKKRKKAKKRKEKKKKQSYLSNQDINRNFWCFIVCFTNCNGSSHWFRHLYSQVDHPTCFKTPVCNSFVSVLILMCIIYTFSRSKYAAQEEWFTFLFCYQ